jgi:hypothetical protein
MAATSRISPRPSTLRRFSRGVNAALAVRQPAEECETRLYAWLVPVSCIFYAHCARCGNLALHRITPDRVKNSAFRLLQLLLRVPAYRCEPCRYRFFSMMPLRAAAPLLAPGAIPARALPLAQPSGR